VNDGYEQPAVDAPRPPDVCTLVVADDACDEEWEGLASATRATPFMRPGWMRAWMAAFAPREQLQLLTVRRDGELVGLLPVLSNRRGTTAPANAETGLVQPLARDSSAARALVSRLMATGWQADLRFVPGGELLDALIAEAGDRGGLHRCELLRESPYTRVEGDFEAYQREVLSKNRRTSLRRRRRRLEERGRVEMDMHDGRENLDALLTEGLRLELTGWKGEQGTAVLSRPDTERFYRSVARWAADAGILRLYLLRLDGRPLAFTYQLEQHGITHSLKLVIDEEFREQGPGVLLAFQTLESAFSRGDLHLYDWGGENEPYKQEFATGFDRQYRLQLYTPGVAGRLDRASATAVSRARAEARRRLSAETRQRIVTTLSRARSAVPGRDGRTK
jgi:CelD/BcsL family acetyltransferase involved in cellulose biosynthesis